MNFPRIYYPKEFLPYTYYTNPTQDFTGDKFGVVILTYRPYFIAAIKLHLKKLNSISKLYLIPEGDLTNNIYTEYLGEEFEVAMASPNFLQAFFYVLKTAPYVRTILPDVELPPGKWTKPRRINSIFAPEFLISQPITYNLILLEIFKHLTAHGSWINLRTKYFKRIIDRDDEEALKQDALDIELFLQSKQNQNTCPKRLRRETYFQDESFNG